jgi:diguanylate cyclase (GGDEF)-like protein
MRDSVVSNGDRPPAMDRAAAHSGQNRERRPELSTPRTLVVSLAGLAAALLCAVHVTYAPRNTPFAAGIGYLCNTLVFLGCAAVFLMRQRVAESTLRIRWMLMAAAVLVASIAYFPSFIEGCFGTGSFRQFQTTCFIASEALYMLAAVLFFAGVARAIVIVDLLQALLFVVQRFNLIYSPATRDHFTHFHLLVSQLVALFLFLIAIVARLGAASREELKFLRIISWFFGLRLIWYFVGDQVSYIWLGYQNSSLWDVVGTVFFSAFALYLLCTSRSAEAEAPEARTPRSRSVAVRSLMPSFLALVNVALGLILLRVSVPLAGAAIALSLLCYVARTALLHAQAVEEKAHLESRNQHLEGLAVRDPLTGIGNRRSLAGRYAVLQTTVGDLGLSILLMDIDHFKKVNDCHGHLHGDHVLVALAKKLESLAAAIAGGHCARFGGDEFALLLPGVAPEAASTLAEDLRASFAALGFKAETGHATLSIGVASLPAARDLPLESLVCRADEALYRAKLLGRNRVEVQPPGPLAGDSPAPRLELTNSALQHSA